MVSRDFNHIFTPLNPPLSRGETRKSSFLPFTRRGLGRGKKYLIHSQGLLKHPLIAITPLRETTALSPIGGQGMSEKVVQLKIDLVALAS